METLADTNKSDDIKKQKRKSKFNLRNLRLSLKYRPEIMKLILKMKQNIKKKSLLLSKMKQNLKKMESILKSQGISKTTQTTDIINSDPSTHKKQDKNIEDSSKSLSEANNTEHSHKMADGSTQTETILTNDHENSSSNNNTKEDSVAMKSPEKKEVEWNIEDKEVGKSIADQVKEAAQSALQQSGMVYVESAGMYYDYKSGYYYNSELGLYYHTDTNCYYYYNNDKKEFVFHSYPDRSAVAANASLAAHEKRKTKKNKKNWKTEEDIDDLTKNLSQEEDEASKPKRKKKDKKTKKIKKITSDSENKDNSKPKMDSENEKEVSEEKNDSDAEVKENVLSKEELEDGECSETANENSDSEESVASTATASDDDTVAKHHPPCMRVIVRETKLPKLKVGSLFLITKDGGTVGREGDQHTILIKDHNVSRNHLDIRYDMTKRMYVATDLGSKNGTLLNGVQMSLSQEISQPIEVVHGSTLQLGETKLLCHIHAGNDTCGHCEPGLIMETQEKEKVAYTRTCSVQKQYQLELARLKNKYVPEPLMIEEGTYNDRAKARRDAVGSTHDAEKTQSSDVDTFIAPENKGFKILEKMGWSKGEGLGKENQGETEPIPLVSNEGKAGLGTPGSTGPPPLVPTPRVRNTLGPATLRLATRSKLLQPPAKAFQNPLEDDSE